MKFFSECGTHQCSSRRLCESQPWSRGSLVLVDSRRERGSSHSSFSLLALLEFTSISGLECSVSCCLFESCCYEPCVLTSRSCLKCCCRLQLRLRFLNVFFCVKKLSACSLFVKKKFSLLK